MLRIYDAENDENISAKLKNEDVIHDVESFFVTSVKLVNDDVTCKLLNEIEQAKYLSDNTFEDRYGRSVYTTELSTGCKAALCVHYFPNKVVDLLECGLNARDAILKYCKDGNVLYYGMNITVDTFDAEDLEVSIVSNERVFHNLDDFNDYFGSYDYYGEMLGNGDK
jgi:hypothetical protein